MEGSAQDANGGPPKFAARLLSAQSGKDIRQYLFRLFVLFFEARKILASLS